MMLKSAYDDQTVVTGRIKMAVKKEIISGSENTDVKL